VPERRSVSGDPRKQVNIFLGAKPFNQLTILSISLLTNGPNKLECYIVLKDLSVSGTNTLAYWTISLVPKKIKCCEK